MAGGYVVSLIQRLKRPFVALELSINFGLIKKTLSQPPRVGIMKGTSVSQMRLNKSLLGVEISLFPAKLVFSQLGRCDGFRLGKA